MIFRVVLDRMIVETGGGAERPQIYVDDSIGLGQQPGGLRRSLLPEIERRDQHKQNQRNGEDRDPRLARQREEAAFSGNGREGCGGLVH